MSIDNMQDINGYIEALKKAQEETASFMKQMKELSGVDYWALFSQKGSESVKQSCTTIKQEMEQVIKVSDGVAVSYQSQTQVVTQTSKAVDDSSKKMKEGLSSVQNGLIAFAGGMELFSTTKDVFADLSTGSTSLSEAALALIPVFVAVGAAMYAAMGPVGIIVGAVAVALGAVAGAIQGVNQTYQEQLNEEFFDGVGEDMEVFGQYFNAVTAEISKTSQAILDMGAAMGENDKKIDESMTQLGLFSTKLNATGRLTKTDADKMKAEFDKLKENVRNNFDMSINMAILSFQNAFRGIGDLVGVEVNAAIDKFLEFQGIFGKYMTKIEKDIYADMNKLQEGRLDKEGINRLNENLKQYSEITKKDTAEKVKFYHTVQQGAEIDYKDPEEVEKTLKDLIAQSETVKKQIDEAQWEQISNLEQLRHQADLAKEYFGSSEEYEEFVKTVNQTIQRVKDSAAQEMSAVDTALKDTMEIFHGGLKEEIERSAKQVVENSNWPWITEESAIKDLWEEHAASGEIFKKYLGSYATGGIPNQGQLFVAREAGAELVGGFGSRTGVMNNDQIVESVSRGVFQAVSSALGLYRSPQAQPTEVKVYLDGKEIYINQLQQKQAQGYPLGMNPALAR